MAFGENPRFPDKPSSGVKMENHSPKVSIITVCLNAEKHIERAIVSVLEQTYKNIEYIIVDGKSTDGTLEIVAKYRDRIHKIISEKDNGVYDAMNKGIRNSSGEIIYFVNSDDRLYDSGVIERVVRVYKKDPSADIIYAKVEPVNFPNKNIVFTGNLTFQTQRDILKNQPCHQCIFAKKTIFDRFGLFDVRYKIAADIDWFYRIFNKNIKIKFVDIYAAFLSLQGLSHQRGFESMLERYHLVFRNFSFCNFLYHVYYRLIILNRYLLACLRDKLKGD